MEWFEVWRSFLSLVSAPTLRWVLDTEIYSLFPDHLNSILQLCSFKIIIVWYAYLNKSSVFWPFMLHFITIKRKAFGESGLDLHKDFFFQWICVRKSYWNKKKTNKITMSFICQMINLKKYNQYLVHTQMMTVM